MRRWSTLLALAAAGLAMPAAAAVQLESVQWQTAAPLVVDAKGGLGSRVVARLKLLNRGAEVGGVLLRYCVTAKIAPAGDLSHGDWAVPFTVDQRRVPRAGANRRLEVPLDATAMTQIQLRRILNDGYIPQELKLTVMLEPRRGEKTPLQTLEATLPVSVKP